MQGVQLRPKMRPISGAPHRPASGLVEVTGRFAPSPGNTPRNTRPMRITIAPAMRLIHT